MIFYYFYIYILGILINLTSEQGMHFELIHNVIEKRATIYFSYATRSQNVT